MNCKEYQLPELELSTGQVRDALQVRWRNRGGKVLQGTEFLTHLQALLHTILFLRSPGPVTPRDVQCEDFDLTYTRISSEYSSFSENSVDQMVDEALETFLRNLSQIGPELLSGSLTLSFFERRASKSLFGLVSHEERIVFEQWIIRVVVNNTPRPVSDDDTAVMERQRIQDTAESMLRNSLSCVFELVGGTMDHLPPVMYEFEISCSKRADDREAMYSRVTAMPPILNLNT